MSATPAIPASTLVSSREGSALAFAVGFFFSARTAAVLFFARALGIESRIGAAIAISIGLSFLVVVCFHSLAFDPVRSQSMLRLPAVRWVFVYLLFSGSSLAWSGSVSVAASFAYWCGMAADVVIVFVLFSHGPVRAASHSLMKGFIFGSGSLALVAWIMPAQSDLRLGDPDYFNTNQIANLCAFAVFMAQYLARRKDGRWALVTAFLALTLIRSLSKSTIAAFAISQAYLLIHDRFLQRRTKVLLFVGAILVVLVFWGLFEAYYDVYTTAGNQAETLTGRTAIWAWSFDAAIEHPWLGNGFDSMWKIIPPIGREAFEARHAENELLQQFFAYGAAGIVMLAGLYGSLYRQARRFHLQPVRVIVTSILIFVVIRGLAVAEPFDLLLPLWCVVLFSVLLASESPAFGSPLCSAPAPSSAPIHSTGAI
jgi:exopolysaccharide production protein ExoQ